MSTKKKLSFEERLASLETLVEQMESGGMSLQESIRRYEDGMQAIAALQKELQAAEQKLTVIRTNAIGQDVQIPIEEDEP